ncbi:hypothetical protein [Xenorhabdus sp. KK7.4]|uniref:hypothetical protein n=1 Tax=Xenorhabdus sp. KK7.4 TaxID=1851572 RepID=UPI000C03D606|nr:hypothetical protein [Xenorhabdus sp. KK7.4]PHM51744.1 tail fiber protein [Xenorhabdus sp. KK7.4]
MAVLEIGDGGWLSLRNGSTGRVTFSVSSQGDVDNCLVPLQAGGTGAKTQEQARTNLNVYDKAETRLMAIPIGASVIWNADAPIPDNFGRNEGGIFSKSVYPVLAEIFPALRLPDDRGYAIRCADNGAGKDPGRKVGTYQDDAMREITGKLDALRTTLAENKTTGALKKINRGGVSVGTGSNTGLCDIEFRASNVVPVAPEFRMKNVAKILITRMK